MPVGGAARPGNADRLGGRLGAVLHRRPDRGTLEPLQVSSLDAQMFREALDGLLAP
ncbi:MAG: hypothetical protein ACYC1P_03125 [Gaiellaceae bacterium]